MTHPFDSIYSHGFIRAAVCIPHVRVADPAFNVERTIALARRASEQQAAVALFPELGLSAYSNDDLFHQDALLDASRSALIQLIDASRDLTPVLLVGAPLRFENKLFNCAVVVYRGQVLGIVPKTYIPNYREFYEKRQFASARDAVAREVPFLDTTVPFGNDLIFEATNVAGFALHAEICEDVWTPIPPSTYAALAGATVLANLSASNITVGKADYRRDLCASQSGKCIAAYLYSAAGPGESTTDLAWDGHALIYENNTLLAESQRFAADEQVITADIDLERLIQDRMRMTSFQDSVADHRERLRTLRRVPFHFQVPAGPVPLQRTIYRFPYVPSDPTSLDERCYEVYNIQVHGLMKRLQATGIQKVVIGVSGGLDSTQALIVAARTMDRLGLPRENILAYTMPGFATSRTTRNNAHALMKALGVSAHEIDIRPSALQMLRDIGHPFANEEEVYDVTFENVQAGERTSHLFRLANFHGGLVLGTGDLSELALGWATYGVGDHMSHYNVNASVPKTLIQYLIRWVANTHQFGEEASRILHAILETEISPELIPHRNGDQERPAQSTEAKIGPYELQDFNLYYITRFGFRPSKVAYLAYHAWRDKNQGPWPDLLPLDKRHEYDLATIKKWLEVFLYRFFQISQFKRSALPNGPKVGSGGSLSPRGDWRAPSDSESVVWLEELRRNVPA
ncbi:NAD(+) synthase [Litorilinea aerophila]|uniref:Glutamine-dependent NAD(+) synthetase n=1 Tax=Litorilinea aerophila TaxID=1204385 RepID=A0A540VJ48_9CHLR|nr:NAD(+) synthase [Litorilinea aerophila]MCC9075639.1 NAD(+) synthase [Litorilinea aerophila]GIV79154.1 MAG: NAD(+) synthase [Litorilinea sp.]